MNNQPGDDNKNKQSLFDNPQTGFIVLILLLSGVLFFVEKAASIILIIALIFWLLSTPQRWVYIPIIIVGGLLIGLTILFYPLFGLLPLFLALPFVLVFLVFKASKILEERFPSNNSVTAKLFFCAALIFIFIILWQFREFFAVFLGGLTYE